MLSNVCLSLSYHFYSLNKFLYQTASYPFSLLDGPKGILSGTITLALSCALIQVAVNEARVQRIRFVSKSTPAHATTHGTHILESVHVPPSELHAHALARDANALPHKRSTDRSPSLVEGAEGSETSSFGERLLALIGITKVSDEEYLRRLKAKREIHLQRIRELEALLEKEKSEEGKDQS